MATLHVFKLGAEIAPYAIKANGAKTIQKALDAAADGDTILVHGAAGPNPANRLVYKENLRVTKAIHLLGQLGEWPIIDGNQTGTVVFLWVQTGPVIVEGFEIRNGKAAGTGGGISVWRCTDATIRNNCIRNNTAPRAGGGINVLIGRWANPQKTVIEDNHIHHNFGRLGGGICKQSFVADSAQRQVTIRRNQIGPDNRALRGGGICIRKGNAVIEDNTIESNRAQGVGGFEASGGGINIRWMETVPASAFSSSAARQQNVQVKGNLIRDNKAQHDGGGMTVEMDGRAVLTNNLLFKNIALRDDAGGIYVTLKSILELAGGNTLRENRAQGNGGGLHVTCLSRAELSGNNLFEGNQALASTGDPALYQGGGGISVRHSQLKNIGNLIVRNNTSGRHGGGIFALTERLSLGNSLCEQDTGLDIATTLVEGNRCDREGAGIAVIKTTAMIPRHPTRIENCIISNNTSAIRDGQGIYIRARAYTLLFHFQPVVRNCLVTGHAQTPLAAGIQIEGLRTLQPRVSGNLVESNSRGLVVANCDAAQIKSNVIRTNGKVNVLLYRTRVLSCTNNEISSRYVGQRTANGVVLVRHKGGALSGNNIFGHSRFGMDAQGPRGIQIDARNNWWGNTAGPTVGGAAAGNPPGDPIRGPILWQPPKGTAVTVSSGAPSSIPGGGLANPPPVVFEMISEYIGGINCV